MNNFVPNNSDEIEQIPRGLLIDLLKSDHVTDFLLDWALQQLDREIALAILMNPKTSQQHLEKLFETFDNYLLDKYSSNKPLYEYTTPEYEQYTLAWDILNTIANHINWEQRQLTGYWQKDIVSKICTFNYPDPFYSSYLNRHLCKIIDFTDEQIIENIVDNSEHSQIYQKFIYQLRKLQKIPPKNKIKSQILHLKVLNTKNSRELEKNLDYKDPEFKIKFSILESPHLTQNILLKVLNHLVERKDYIKLIQDKNLSLAFKKYPDIAKIFLKRLFAKNNNECNLFLAGYIHTPSSILEKLAQFYDVGIHAKLAGNPNTPEHILLKLLKQNNCRVIPELRRNPNLPDLIAEQLPDINDNYLNWDIAHRDISVDDLKKLALTSNDNKERERIVYNPNTNNEILEILAKDPDDTIRYRVAATYGTPLYLLKRLAKDKNEQVRYAVLSNPQLTKDIFYQLMPDIYGCCNYSLGRLLAFLDPNVSPEILEQNASSLLWNERFAIAIHPKTPSKTVEQLAKDGNVYVREIAQQRKKNCG